MIIKFLKALKDWTDPNYWGQRLGDKTKAFEKAENSKLRKWVDSLEGWKWWAWQLGPGLIFIALIEWGLNQIGLTIIPFRWW